MLCALTKSNTSCPDEGNQTFQFGWTVFFKLLPSFLHMSTGTLICLDYCFDTMIWFFSVDPDFFLLFTVILKKYKYIFLWQWCKGSITMSKVNLIASQHIAAYK